MTTPETDSNTRPKPTKVNKERQFKGLSLTERKHARREKLIEAGIETYGTQGFFSVTVKDVCNEAKLTERYFYESFKKSEDLFQTIFLKLIETLQQNVMQSVMQAAPDPAKMIDAGLGALLRTLKDDPRLARIIYIDAMLVQELHNQATIQETMLRFDRMIQAFVMLMMPNLQRSEQEVSLIATGLNGYVTQIAIRWVMGGFKQSQEDVLFACRTVFLSLVQTFSQKQK
ncbi:MULTISPECIES: TetR/AcrR family transcriptional regulator [Acinetobacter]|uniref:TetR/AcrR family transcriptional regulator n=1 Tax=Acinetobacter TaxID=469 RepID=UPI00044B87AE|nr:MULTISPECIES: TetR/AcrR family transcriptional regulator [Acinetobacter]EXD35489.1 bacterial regulatory s, tetR family protein [Acinetobacter sp. 479375]MEC8055822.1 TetR/AcrR family transcriptional regulator [Pseudomonadota bacterium]NOZ97956.1 TetR/AcrR family transcriptional regulator [Gammaproteobacteria bacterium]